MLPAVSEQIQRPAGENYKSIDVLNFGERRDIVVLQMRFGSSAGRPDKMVLT